MAVSPEACGKTLLKRLAIITEELAKIDARLPELRAQVAQCETQRDHLIRDRRAYESILSEASGDPVLQPKKSRRLRMEDFIRRQVGEFRFADVMEDPAFADAKAQPVRNELSAAVKRSLIESAGYGIYRRKA